MAHLPALIDSDTLSEVMKGRDSVVLENAQLFLTLYGRFRFSMLTRYEILRGLASKQAAQQIRFARIPDLQLASWHASV